MSGLLFCSGIALSRECSSWTQGRRLPVCIRLPVRLHCPSTRDVPHGCAESAQAVISNESKPSPPKGTILLDNLSVGDKLVGQVLRVGPANSLWLDVGVVRHAKRGEFRSVDARLRFPVVSKKQEDGKVVCKAITPREKVGSRLSVFVKKASAGSGRLEVERVNKTMEELSLLRKRRRRPRPVEGGTMLDTLTVGQCLEGRVVRLGSYGALIDCGIARRGRRGSLVAVTGLMRRNNFPEKCASDYDLVFRDDIERKLCVGDDVTVYVRAAYAASGFLWFSGTPVDEETLKLERKEKKRANREWSMRKDPRLVSVGEVRPGTVVRQMPYGAFIDIGLRTNALLHYKNIGKEYQSEWRLKLLEEARVLVKIISNENDRVGVELIGTAQDILAEAEEKYGPLVRPREPEPMTVGEMYQKVMNDAVNYGTFAIKDGRALRPDEMRGALLQVARAQRPSKRKDFVTQHNSRSQVQRHVVPEDVSNSRSDRSLNGTKLDDALDARTSVNDKNLDKDNGEDEEELGNDEFDDDDEDEISFSDEYFEAKYNI